MQRLEKTVTEWSGALRAKSNGEGRPGGRQGPGEGGGGHARGGGHGRLKKGGKGKGQEGRGGKVVPAVPRHMMPSDTSGAGGRGGKMEGWRWG